MKLLFWKKRPLTDFDATDPPPPFDSGIELVSDAEIVIPRENAASDVAYSLALAFVALVPRLFVALAWAREPVWDGHYYHLGAQRIAQGFGYSEAVNVGGTLVDKPWTHYPVGYSGLLSLFYRVFGTGIEVAPIVNAFLGTLLVVLVHRIARYALSPTRARVAGAIAALHPGLIAYSAVVMTEPTAAVFLLGAAWAAVALRNRWSSVVLIGVLLGVGALIRPASLLALPALVLIGPRPLWKSIARMFAIAAVSLVTILPWTIRNCRVMDGCALISTNGGWNLAIGALTTTGRFQTLRAADGCPVVTGQVQQDRCWGEVGVARIKDAPARWLGLIPMKLSQTYDHESFPVEYLREAAPELWPENRRTAGRDLLTAYHYALIALASLSPIALITSLRRKISSVTQAVLFLTAAGLISYCFSSPEHPFFVIVLFTSLISLLPFPGRPTFGPLGRYLQALLAATTVTHAVFFGEDRYHLVVTPLLCILAASALRRQFRPAAWAPE